MTKCDLKQFDKAGLIYFPLNFKKPTIAEWSKLKKSKKDTTSTNYGILCGEKTGITVIDIDNKPDTLKVKNGVNFWNLLLKKFNNNEDLITPIVKTGGGGYHIYFKYNENIKTSTEIVEGYTGDGYKIKYSIDARNNGGYVVAPGSIHESKKKYKFVQEFEECEPMEMPEWLIKCFNNIVVIQNDEITFLPKQKPIKTVELIETAEESPETFNKDLFIEILKNLDKTRADDFTLWRNFCFGVGAVAHLYKWDLKKELLDFSKQSKKYNEMETLKLYEEGDGRIGIGSFWFWLKEDNPVIFNELYNKNKTLMGDKVYYYSDYRKLLQKHDEQGYINYNNLYNYFKGAFVKIDNGGNTMWFSRNINKFDKQITDWEIINNGVPFRGNNDYYVYLDDPEKNKEAKKVKLSELLHSATRKPDFPVYNGIDFIPYLRKDKSIADNVFNLFTGFPHVEVVEEQRVVDIKKIEKVLYHIKKVLCSENEDIFKYYISYLAHIAQRPAIKPGTAIVFISEEGLGKDIINHDFLKLVFGAKYVHRLNNLSELTRNFNKKLQNKLLTVLGELKSYKSEADIEKLKGLITDTTITIEPKGVDPYEILDDQRFIFHTNNSIPFQISETDRRFIIHRIPKKYIQNREYYDKLAGDVFNPIVAREFFKYLCEYDIKDFNPRTIPNTTAKNEIQRLTLNGVMRFMLDVIEGNFNIDSKTKDGDIYIHLLTLYNNYNTWRELNGESTKTSQKIFKQRLSEKGFEAKRLRIGNKDALGYKFNFEQLQKQFEKFISKEEEQSEDINFDEDESEE